MDKRWGFVWGVGVLVALTVLVGLLPRGGMVNVECEDTGCRVGEGFQPIGHKEISAGVLKQLERAGVAVPASWK